MLSHVVVVARFLGEEARRDHRVDLGGSRIGGGEERAAVDLADVLACRASTSGFGRIT